MALLLRCYHCKSSKAFRWWSFIPHLGRMNERNDKWPCGWSGRLRFNYLRASISNLIITSSEGGSLWLNLHSQSLSCLKSSIMNYGFCCSIQWKPPPYLVRTPRPYLSHNECHASAMVSSFLPLNIHRRWWRYNGLSLIMLILAFVGSLRQVMIIC